MNKAFPPHNYELSPFTGWTRAHWEHLLARMTYGYVRAAQQSGSPARVLYPDDRRGLSDAVDAIESFARIASAWSAWLRNPANPAGLNFQGHRMDVEALLRQALLEGTDPTAERTYWGDIGHMDQRLVESADIAVAVWLSRERVFGKMTPAEQAQVMNWLAQVDGKGTYADNWILFPAIAQAVRLHLGYPAPEKELDNKLAQMAEFYRGDGWYVDGLGDEFDLYNAWMFNWHYLLWAQIDGERRPEHRCRVLERARSFLAGFVHFFGANGSYPAWGRSLIYRFAAVAAFATGYWLDVAPADPGLLRRLSSGCIKYFCEHGLFDPNEHYVRQGFHGDFPAAGEPYISPGSPYWCCHGLFALTFDSDDPFWTAVESPLTIERSDFELVLPAPGFVLSGRRATGQVLQLNSRSGQEHDAPRYNYTTKYGKLTYSTHFPFNVLPAGSSYAPDVMIGLTRDDQSFGHRTRTRAGGTAPGLIWCRFDEILDGEIQPMWVAVLLWGDRQIRLAAVRPTFPVRAFEAPGALGCERPASIMRRSDRQAGWEYAEVEGRALAIRRLLGYDDQCASAPFLGQSNINLAYTYAEQPMVCEARPSVQPRCLASASLVRPTPFDPTQELSGIQVRGSWEGVFQVSLPNGETAFVALGEGLPQITRLAGTEFKGPGLRYARLAADLSKVCGSGVTQVAGVVELSASGTFRVTREAESVVRVLTDAGIALADDWVGGAARRAQVTALDGTQIDVSEQCGVNTIPAELVREWSRRNERTLVEFHLSL
jgi:hypothetical protein